MWPLINLTEAKIQHGEAPVNHTSALNLFINQATDALARRVEPRTKANLYGALLIAKIRLEAPLIELSALHQDMKVALGLVGQGLTVFSQFEKRNVSTIEFSNRDRRRA